MRKNTIAAIVIASLLGISAPAFAGNSDSGRVLKNEGRQHVWVEKGDKAPHALTGQASTSEQERTSERRAFGRAGYAVR